MARNAELQSMMSRYSCPGLMRCGRAQVRAAAPWRKDSVDPAASVLVADAASGAGAAGSCRSLDGSRSAVAARQ